MKRQISSKITFVSKILVPVIVTYFGATTTFAIIVDSLKGGQLPLPLPVRILYPVLWIVAIAFLYWFSARLKVVSVDDNFLYVSNYLKETSVTFSNISELSESRLKGHPVTIHFNTPTEFGGKITFIPKMRFFDFGSHPIVGELKQLAKINL